MSKVYAYRCKLCGKGYHRPMMKGFGCFQIVIGPMGLYEGCGGQVLRIELDETEITRARRFVRTTLESLFHVHPNETHNVLNEMDWFEASHVPDTIVEEIIEAAREGIIEGFLGLAGEGYREGRDDR